jgi:hypothetical protein
VVLIYSLKPNVTRDEAIAALSPRSFLGATRTLIAGPLRSIAAVYVPFQMFRVTIRNGKRQEQCLLAIEAVRGSLDLYGLEQAPLELVRIETRNFIPSRLAAEPAAELLKEKLRRMIFRRGFFRVRDLSIETSSVGPELHIPYWVGFRAHGDRAHLAVLDAVRRRIEGDKARDLFRGWLLGSGETIEAPHSTALAQTGAQGQCPVLRPISVRIGEKP